jgi:hypothetical protein
MKIIPWTPLRLLATHNFFPWFFVYTPFVSMKNIFLHITINYPFTHSFSSSPKKTQDKFFLFPKLSMTPLWAYCLCLIEVVEILLSNQWLPHLSWTNGNWKWFDPPMEFKMRILVLNETLKKFHPPIKIRW